MFDFDGGCWPRFFTLLWVLPRDRSIRTTRQSQSLLTKLLRQQNCGGDSRQEHTPLSRRLQN